MLGRTLLVQKTYALTSRLNLQIVRIFPHIHPNERTMQKDSAYLPDLGCYAETFSLKRSYAASSYWY